MTKVLFERGVVFLKRFRSYDYLKRWNGSDTQNTSTNTQNNSTDECKKIDNCPEDPCCSDPKEEYEHYPDNDKLPEEPSNCCMSACANCVWLEYAEKLSEYFKDGGEQAVKEINEKVSDPNIRAFLLHELRMREKCKKDT